jgi:hypothetical protein
MQITRKVAPGQKGKRHYSRVQFSPDVGSKCLKPRQLRVLADLTQFYA